MSFVTDIISASTISGTTLYGDGYNITNINEQEFYLWDLVVQGNKLLNGGVSYVSGLTFDVSILEYIINGQVYNITSGNIVTLNSGDTTFDRIDVIYADINGLVGILEGTPSANPEKPISDGDTQVEVTFISVPANATTPNVNSFLIYNENTGSPTEWNFNSIGTQANRISGSSTDQSYSGTTSIRVSGVTGIYTTAFRLSGNTTVDTNQYATLQFAMRNLSANTTTSQIRLRFLTTGGTQNGGFVYMNAANSSGFVQYSSNNTSGWQLISIPLWRFYLTNTNVQMLEISFRPTTLPSNYYFDMIQLVEGTASSPPSNSWTTIKGDSTQTITATNPNATLTISGGTNLTSTVVSPSTVKLNLDSDINLNGITAVTLSTGFNTTNSGAYSVSSGFNTTSYGTSSHSEGFSTLAEGYASHAEGESTIAFGTGSHTEGLGTYTSGDHQTAVGKFNATGNTTQGAFIVGNGIGNNNRTNLIFAAESAVTINYDLNVSGTTNLNETLINQDRITILNSFVPTGSTDPSYTTGTITWDDNFLYWKTSTQWLRISGDTW